MAIQWVLPPKERWDFDCHDPVLGPCKECREALDASFNPRHLPSVLGEVHINPHCVIIEKAYNFATDDSYFIRRN